MKSIIVADTSPLIALAKLQQLTLLNSEFSSVHVPLTVLSEATRDMQRPDARLIRDFASKHLIVRNYSVYVQTDLRDSNGLCP